MNTPEAALGRKAPGAMWAQGPWLHSQRWDLLCITGSSVLVVVPLVLYAVMGHSATFVNLFIAGVIGGPHMYATFFRTFLDASFWHRHRLLVGCSLGIPGTRRGLCPLELPAPDHAVFLLGFHSCAAPDRLYSGML